MIDIKKADNEVKEMYDYLSEISNSIVKRYSATLDDLVKKLSKDIDVCSNEELRSYMGKISVEAYNLGLCKEQSALKELCADALYKEGVAKSFNSNSGTIEARKNQSIIDTMDKQAISILYGTVSSLLKVKADEAHRLTSTINGILISRSADAKLQYNPRGTNSLDMQEEGTFY